MLHAQPPRLRRDLRATLADGACFAVMTGVGENYFPAFVLAMGLGEIAAGLIATIPMLIGSVLQVLAPLGVRLVRSDKRWVIFCVACQACSFLPLIQAAFQGRIGWWAAFAVVSLYWFGGVGGAAPWTTWIGGLVPAEVRAAFFARRNRLIQACVVVTLLAAGAALEQAASSGRTLAMFGLIFCVGFAARATSVCMLSATSEHRPSVRTDRSVSLAELGRRLVRGGDTRVLLYLLAGQAAAQVATPYFAPFMLKEVRFTYVEFTVLVATAIVARVLTTYLWGRVATRYGTRRLLWIGAAAIVPHSLLWLVSDGFWYLLAAQFYCGFAWAAWELAALLFYIEGVRAEERTSILTTYNVINAFTIVAGSLAGAGLLHVADLGRGGYFVVFAASAVARLAALLALRHTGASRPSDGDGEGAAVPRPVVADYPSRAGVG